jgi:hypothetical protein
MEVGSRPFTADRTAQASELSASRWCAVGLDAAERVPVGTVTGQHQFTKPRSTDGLG